MTLFISCFKTHLLLLDVSGGAGLHVTGAPVIAVEEDAVSPGQLGGGPGVGGGDGAVEDAEEPDHQAHDILGLEVWVLLGVGGQGGHSAVPCMKRLD